MRRLFEDPESPEALRDDLLRSRAAGQDYPSADKLAQLRAALADPERDPLAEGSRGAEGLKRLTWRAVHPGWKLAALLVVGGAASLALRPSAHERSPSAVASQPTAAEPELPAAVKVSPSPSLAEGAPHADAAVDQDKSPRREIAQLVRIRAWLEQDPLAAYRLAQRSERDFPDGLLSEERRALSIVALHRTGKRAAAAAEARAFFARFPQSPMREVIEAELARDRK